MFKYSKEKYECYIANINHNIAHVVVFNEKEEKSSMEIHEDDFILANIEFRAGILFSFTSKKFFGWEKIVFKSIKRTTITQKEFDKMIKYYEKRYGDA